MSKTRSTRVRRWRGSAVALAVAALVLPLSACGSSQQDAGDGAGTAPDAPLKIGVLLPYTGAFGLYGKPMEAALRARFAAAGDSVDGRKVELVFEDEATDPGTAVTKATKLVEQDGVVAVVCCATGSATLAVGPVLAERSIPQLGPDPQPRGALEVPDGGGRRRRQRRTTRPSSGSTPRPRSVTRRPLSWPATSRTATRWPTASRRDSPGPGARWSRRCTRHWGPATSVPTSPRSLMRT